MTNDNDNHTSQAIAELETDIRFLIRHGFLNEPAGPTPFNIFMAIDETTIALVVDAAIRTALLALADKGFISDTGSRIVCNATGESEIIWHPRRSIADHRRDRKAKTRSPHIAV
jgi:hypothetical protein